MKTIFTCLVEVEIEFPETDTEESLDISDASGLLLSVVNAGLKSGGYESPFEFDTLTVRIVKGKKT